MRDDFNLDCVTRGHVIRTLGRDALPALKKLHGNGKRGRYTRESLEDYSPEELVWATVEKILAEFQP